MKWDEKAGIWKEDEWLIRICVTERIARELLYAFGDGRPFDDSYEKRVTRYFGKRRNPLIHGDEFTDKDDKRIVEREWMRYARFAVCEESEDISHVHYGLE